VWRRAAATPGAWGTRDLALDGKLGMMVRDERFERLMLYCGDVKHLEVRDAWYDFTGPPVSLAAKFASLTTVVLTGCESVRGASIVELMKAIGMTTRPKKDRLRRLHLDGCMVYDTDLRKLSACVFLGRLENFVACIKSPGRAPRRHRPLGVLHLWRRHAHLQGSHVRLVLRRALCRLPEGTRSRRKSSV
jgi:hypothetical protein